MKSCLEPNLKPYINIRLLQIFFMFIRHDGSLILCFSPGFAPTDLVRACVCACVGVCVPMRACAFVCICMYGYMRYMRVYMRFRVRIRALAYTLACVHTISLTLVHPLSQLS